MLNLTQRDLKILQFINEFGFCDIQRIRRQFGMEEKNAYRIMHRLCKYKVVCYERIFIRQAGAYRVTKAGAVHTDLPALKALPVNRYNHQLRIVDVFIKLSKLYLEALWVSERRLLQDRTYKDILNKTHTADGFLFFPDGTKVAIEVELTMKSEHRLTKIFGFYAGQFSIKEVWYYCWPNMLPLLENLTQKRRSYIKIFNLKEMLALNGEKFSL